MRDLFEFLADFYINNEVNRLFISLSLIINRIIEKKYSDCMDWKRIFIIIKLTISKTVPKRKRNIVMIGTWIPVLIQAPYCARFSIWRHEWHFMKSAWKTLKNTVLVGNSRMVRMLRISTIIWNLKLDKVKSMAQTRSLSQSKEALLKSYTKRLKDDVKSILDNFTEIVKSSKVQKYNVNTEIQC